MVGPKIVVISGPGGSGKNTIVDMLLTQLPNAVPVVTATTYPPRPGEKEGVDHYFLTKEQFEQKIKNGELLEYAQVRGALFGALKRPVENVLYSGKNAVMEVNVDGGLSIKKAYPTQTVLIFINAENTEELVERMRDRGIDDERGIKTRLEEAEREIKIGKSQYDHYVVNPTGHPEVAVEQIKEIIKSS